MCDHIDQGRIDCHCCHDEDGYVMTQARELIGYRDVLYTRKISGSNALEKAQILRRIRHDNFVRLVALVPREDPDIVDAKFEFMPIGVVDLCAKLFPHFGELALAAILGQVLQGLAYLENIGLRHTRLRETKILASIDGTVKICGQESCQSGSMNTVELLPLTHCLMYPWAFGKVVPENANKWPEDSMAQDFLRMLLQARATLGDLLKHPLLQLPWSKDHVKELVMFSFRGGRCNELPEYSDNESLSESDRRMPRTSPWGPRD